MEVLPPLRAGILRKCFRPAPGYPRGGAAGPPTFPKGSDLNLEDAVAIETFPSKAAADLVASLLESEGIETWVLTDDAGGAYPALQLTQGVQLFVSRENEEWAKEILADLPELLPDEGGEEADSR
jgi:hypothetical protein